MTMSAELQERTAGFPASSRLCISAEIAKAPGPIETRRPGHFERPFLPRGTAGSRGFHDRESSRHNLELRLALLAFGLPKG